jgi:hypothetical protein
MNKPIPYSFQKLQQEIETQKNKEQAKEDYRQARYKAESDLAFTNLSAALKEYDGVCIGDKFIDIFVSDERPNDKYVALYINKSLYVTFIIKREFRQCSCDNACDCPEKTWLAIWGIEHVNPLTTETLYFGCNEGRISGELLAKK